MTLFRDPLSEKLTEAPIDRQARMTFPGMAHFAGSYPDNTGTMTCRQCKFWQHRAYSYSSKTGKHHGLIKPAVCAQYKAMTGEIGKPVPDDAVACKYFEYNVSHPRRFA